VEIAGTNLAIFRRSPVSLKAPGQEKHCGFVVSKRNFDRRRGFGKNEMGCVLKFRLLPVLVEPGDRKQRFDGVIQKGKKTV
jgi:hypothetical protein